MVYNVLYHVEEREKNMNIIIVGCGKVGQTLAYKLSLESDNNIIYSAELLSFCFAVFCESALR